MTQTFLGLDAGGSGTKWVLLRADQVQAAGRVAPLTTALLPTPSGQAALQELKKALPAPPDAIWAGLPGLSAGSPQADEMAQALAAALGVPIERVGVESDLDLAYSAHLQPAAGLLLYAGTGSIAYHRAASGEAFRAGGRGYRIGDDGGAASLGREALRWLTDQLDVGEQPSGPLPEELAAITGGLDWETLRAFVYGTAGAASLARLAPAVSRAAGRGDGAALNLLQQAAWSLANLAHRLQRQLGARDAALPVVATGGTLQSLPLQAALRQALPSVTIQFRDHARTAAEKASARL